MAVVLKYRSLIFTGQSTDSLKRGGGGGGESKKEKERGLGRDEMGMPAIITLFCSPLQRLASANSDWLIRQWNKLVQQTKLAISVSLHCVIKHYPNDDFSVRIQNQYWCLNPLSPYIHIQILQTDLYTFP